MARGRRRKDKTHGSSLAPRGPTLLVDNFDSANRNPMNLDPISALNKMTYETFIESKGQFTKLLKYFKKANQLELITTISSLQLIKENQCQIPRLEIAMRIACSYNQNGKRINLNQFKNMINTNLSVDGWIGKDEDPIEDVFTDNIILNNDYTVYTGISHNECFTLQNLLNTIFFYEDEFTDEFTDLVKISSIFLLSLVNEVANRSGHSRYIDGNSRRGKRITLPKNVIKALRPSVIFKKTEIDSLLNSNGHCYDYIMTTDVSNLIIPLEHENFEKIINSVFPLEKNPLDISPLVQINDKIVIGVPGSVIAALRHFIFVLSDNLGSNDILIDKYREYLWKKIDENLDKMFYKKVDLKLPSWKWDGTIKEGIFQIDIDKIAYVQMVTDDLSDYDKEDAYGKFNIDNFQEEIAKRYEVIVEWLRNQGHCSQVLILTIFGESGRAFSIPKKTDKIAPKPDFNSWIPKIPDNAQMLLMDLEGLEEVVLTYKSDNLTLWKYAKALNRLLRSVESFNTSFLDQYAYYLENNHSFYHDDKINTIYIGFGMGKDIRVDNKQMWDNHTVLHISGKPVPVIRFIRDKDIPIYLIKGGSIFFEHVVEGYNMPIWISSAKNVNQIVQEFQMFYLQTAEMIAYWLWQITPNFRPHLENIDTSPILITFDIEKPELWEINENKPNTPEFNLNFKKEINGNHIKLILPEDLRFFFRRSDNEGERIIINELIHAFNEILIENGHNSLNDTEINRIVNIHAPLGIKRKIFILDNDIVPLDTKNVHLLRLLQDHDIEEQLDDLVGHLGKLAPHIGEITEDKNKTKLCNDVVSYYNEKLTQILSKYQWDSIIEKLMSYNEAIHHDKAVYAMRIGPLIECYSDIQSQLEKDIKKLSNLERSSLCLRALIEKVVAEPPEGDHELSMDEFDQMFAIMFHIINWAMLSDDIHLKLTNTKMSILETGRIGVEKNEIESVWDPFRRSKTLENTETAIKSFESYFNDDELDNSKISSEMEDAFEAEFGFTLSRIIEFLELLISIVYEQNKTIARMNVSELKERLKTNLKMDDTQSDDIIDLFSLKRREKWLQAPKGFENIDVWPWRYNRRLSYLRRPIIVGPEPEDDPLTFWGPKHVFETGRNLVSLVRSGRYKGVSSKMKSFRGDIVRERGNLFTKDAKKWFEENTTLKIEDEVSIEPGKQLNSQENLGDIDIFIIDDDKKSIFSIECKYTNYARNPREVRHEIDTIMEDKDDEDSWITKHTKRDEWLKSNVEEVSRAFNLPLDSFQIFSVFLTAHEIPTTYIHDLEIPFISFTRLKREGINTFYDLFDLD